MNGYWWRVEDFRAVTFYQLTAAELANRNEEEIAGGKRVAKRPTDTPYRAPRDAIAELRSAARSLFHSFPEAREQIHGFMKYCQHSQLTILSGVEDVMVFAAKDLDLRQGITERLAQTPTGDQIMQALLDLKTILICPLCSLTIKRVIQNALEVGSGFGSEAITGQH